MPTNEIKYNKNPKLSGYVGIKWMPAILEALQSLDGTARTNEVRDWIADKYKVSDEEREETYEKSGARIFDNQVAFAREYLKKAGFLDGSVRGIWSLTPQGSKTKLSVKEASQLFNHINRERQKKKNKAISDENIQESLTQTEEIEEELLSEDEETNIEMEVLQKLKAMTPKGFEHFCKKLLYDYGLENVNVTGKSGDGGIDGSGLLKINAFVKISVIFQCKRYAGNVPASDVREFGFNVLDKKDVKGIFLTTGYFSKNTRLTAR